jgi:hypothetical protein
MDPNVNIFPHELNRAHTLHNPWEKFTHRNESGHYAEDASRLHSLQQATSSSQTTTLPQITSVAVIDGFLGHNRKLLDNPIPRQRQLLREFLAGSIVQSSRNSSHRNFDADISDSSNSGDIALLDDRQKHPDCMKSNRRACPDCVVFSTSLTVPQLLQRLQDQVSIP